VDCFVRRFRNAPKEQVARYSFDNSIGIVEQWPEADQDSEKFIERVLSAPDILHEIHEQTCCRTSMQLKDFVFDPFVASDVALLQFCPKLSHWYAFLGFLGMAHLFNGRRRCDVCVC